MPCDGQEGTTIGMRSKGWSMDEDLDAVGNVFVSGNSVAVVEEVPGDGTVIRRAHIFRSREGWIVIFKDHSRVQFVSREWVQKRVVRLPR